MLSAGHCTTEGVICSSALQSIARSKYPEAHKLEQFEHDSGTCSTPDSVGVACSKGENAMHQCICESARARVGWVDVVPCPGQCTKKYMIHGLHYFHPLIPSTKNNENIELYFSPRASYNVWPVVGRLEERECIPCSYNSVEQDRNR